MLRYWDFALRYSLTMDRVRNYLTYICGKNNVECMLEGDGIFLINIGHVLPLSRIPFKYYCVSFAHNAGSDEFPVSKEYLKEARTRRVIKCVDLEEAKLIAKAMYGDPVATDECLGEATEIWEPRQEELDKHFLLESLHVHKEMAINFGGEVIEMNPLTVRLPNSETIREKILSQ